MSDRLHRGANGKLFEFARKNRGVMTSAEQILWNQLRARRFLGFKFRRQHPVGSVITDFFCLEKNLAIEVDGEYHDDEEQKQADLGRTQALNDLGIIVIRFSNDQVRNRIDEVLEIIRLELIKPKGAPAQKSSPHGEDLGEV